MPEDDSERVKEGQSPPPPKGTGKGPAKGGKGPPAKGKAKGKEASPSSVPSWQKPEISSEWQVERMVNWQPIRQTSRLEGSVWQQVHDSLDGGAAKLPENLLERFMRKVSEAGEKRSSDVGLKKAVTKRLLSSKQALVADIHHALLTRKGIRKVDDLLWLLGPSKDGEEVPAEEVLEAVQGLLGAAVGEERNLTAAGQAMKDGAPSEVFLRQLLEREPLQELQLRLQLNLDMARFNPKADDLESGLDLALTAAWTIIDSQAMPVLLEGILLLGNSVNASSKNLGGAVGVTLESLTKLAHTRCLPAKQAAGGKRKSSRVESALEVLALHLDQANEGFICNLISDLDACQSAKDFDHKMMAGLVQELAAQVKQVRKQLNLHPQAEAPCIQPQRLQDFLTTADERLQHLQKCLDEIDEATVSLRQWFAEPASSSLHDMLKALAALRKLLPVPKPSEVPPPVRDYRLSSTRKRRLEEKKKAQAEKDQLEPTSVSVSLPIPDDRAADQDAHADVSPEVENQPETENVNSEEPKEEKPEKTSQALPRAPSQPLSLPSGPCDVAPSHVLSQILSWSKGSIWISWLFDWTDVHRGFAEVAEKICAFEVLQFNDCINLSQDELNSRRESSRWRCPTAPLKTDVPLGCHYVFAVRAILLKGANLEDAEMLWASSLSSPVTLDLRYSMSGVPSLPVGFEGEETSPKEASPDQTSPQSKSPFGTPRRGRVASGMGDFISSLKAGGSPTTRRLSLRPPGQRIGVESLNAEGPEAPILPEHVEPSLSPSEAKATSDPSPPEKAKEDGIDGSPTPSHVLETASPASETTGMSFSTNNPQDELDDLDDESLLRLVQAFSCLETTRASTSTATSSRRESTPKPEKVDNSATSQGSNLKVPRAASIFDDLDTLESMADMLCKENVNVETEQDDSTKGHLQTSGSSEILDGAEVLAQIEKQYMMNKKCETCNGTGYVGLFGAQGFGLLQTKCRSCSK